MDQNVRKKDSPSLDRDSESVIPYYLPDSFDKEFLKDPFDGGFNIDWVKDANGAPLRYTINMTMMRVELPHPIKIKNQFNFVSTAGGAFLEYLEGKILPGIRALN